ncbi:MAG: 3-methyl-2-oxobutanoate hydroxymethyltransferase [Proteobacteria bacterium SG_bin7]|nr:MAG: 3-methyl-2-oxobutanoate hydroxymethyltransferase [Proteobacteria bacterium SG_bin7]
MRSVLDFQKKKASGEKITLLTCYDYWSACLLEKTDIDALLVGDSVSMVVHGNPSTLSATTDLMASHTGSVARGAKSKFIIGDMPFLSFRKDLNTAMTTVEKLMSAGAHAVKLEGVWGHEELVRHIVQSGVPVMGHIGLTPQSVNQLGGYKVQGKSDVAAEDLVSQAKKLEELGCFSVVVECVPKAVGKFISESVHIPVIGIGAGSEVDGQVLVLHDMLGFGEKSLKFVRTYVNGGGLIKEAVDAYCKDVVGKKFPSDEESFI